MMSLEYLKELSDTISYELKDMKLSFFYGRRSKESIERRLDEIENILKKDTSLDKDAIQSDWKKVIDF
jgi:hypothetical protein